MANDKDFIVKNAVEVGGPTKVTLGTITSSDIDLSTGNYFSDTLAANTTYTISNAGDVQSFQLEVTGGALVDVSNSSYASKSFSVSSQSIVPTGIAFSSDGTAMYISSSDNTDEVFQYTLSTAFDISTASYASKSLSVSSQTSQCRGLSFKSDGTSVYIASNVGASESIFQYNLTTAWDISTASYASKSADVSATAGEALGVSFNSTGTKMYVIGRYIYQFSLSTAWDVSTASYDSVSFDLGSGNHDGAFTSDGSVFLTSHNTGDAIKQFNLSTSFDVSTMSDSGLSFSVASQDSTPLGVAVASSDDNVYIVGASNDTAYQYTLGSTDATLTWPSSIEWAGGVAPAAPATGETDLFSISTDDSGTTYQGFKTADNLS